MKVTAAIIAYNHEKSLAAAVHSAFDADRRFRFRDCRGGGSFDRRHSAVVQDLERRYPHRIRAICRDENLGPTGNFIEALPLFRGEYVALLEGDDIWTDPRKLQRQADFLDGHADCSLCCHAVNYVHEDGSRPPEPFPASANEVSSLSEILAGVNFHTCSFMFRRCLLSPPDWLRTLWIGDWPILMLLAEQGNVGYIDEVMSEYRIHSGGIWSGSSPIRRSEELLRVFQYTRKHLGTRCSAETARRLASWACRLSYDLELAGRREEARQRLVEAIAVLLEETPGDLPLVEGLMRNAAALSDLVPIEASSDVARLIAEVSRLRAEVAQAGQPNRDHLAGVGSAEGVSFLAYATVLSVCARSSAACARPATPIARHGVADAAMTPRSRRIRGDIWLAMSKTRRNAARVFCDSSAKPASSR